MRSTEPAADPPVRREWKWIETDMKDVWSLAMFAIGALCFVTFVTTVKPDAIKPVPASSKSERWKR